MTIQEIIIETLKTDNIWTFSLNLSRDDEDRYLADSLRKLRETADDLKKLAEEMKGDIEHVVNYVSGEPGRFNSLGVLQAQGPRFDAYCMLFRERTEAAERELRRAGFER